MLTALNVCVDILSAVEINLEVIVRFNFLREFKRCLSFLIGYLINAKLYVKWVKYYSP